MGASGYFGNYTERREEFVFTPPNTFSATRPVQVAYSESNIAADLKWTWKGLLVQSEVIVNDLAYDNAHRPYQPPFGPGAPAGFLPDFRSFGVYALAGHRFRCLGLMPWFGWERYDDGAAGANTSAAFWGGLNLRPTPRVVLKAQWTYSYFPDEDALFSDFHYNAIDLQAAWSF